MGARISYLKTEDPGAHIRWSEFGYGVLESAAAVPFVRLEGACPAEWKPEDYAGGLLFGERRELRWRRRRDGRFHLVQIDDDGAVLGDVEGAMLDEVEREPRQIALWGEWEEGTPAPSWYEARIPRPVVYPYGGKALRLAVRLRHYRMEQAAPRRDAFGGVTWKPQAIYVMRCCGLEEFGGGVS